MTGPLYADLVLKGATVLTIDAHDSTAQTVAIKHGRAGCAASVDVNTRRLYTDAMKLLNVRLDEEAARQAADLRRAGVKISRLVRDAIRTEHEQRLGARGKTRTVDEIMDRIYAEHPDPPEQPRRRLDLRDRRAVQRAIVGRFRRTRS
jgi:hypothetical protein